MKILTLTTDFGTGDFGIGQMQGVIWKIAPETRIIDLSHDISPHNIDQAALMLGRTTPYFPPGTVHIVVVDPGVGTQRRAIAAALGNQFFVGPDNGVFHFMLENARKAGGPITIVHLNNPEYWLSDVTDVFHGRDIFSPVGAYISKGVTLPELGAQIHDAIQLDGFQAAPMPGGWQAKVIEIDHFGNLQVNLSPLELMNSQEVQIQVQGAEIHGLVNTFGDRAQGELIALIDSYDHLCISIVNGSAADKLNAQVGVPVFVLLNP